MCAASAPRRAARSLSLPRSRSAPARATVWRIRLWDGPSPRHALRQMLLVLRQRLGPHADRVVMADGTVSSSALSGLETDLAEFEAHLAAGRVEAACTLWRGPFCEGLDAGGDGFEEWLALERARIDDFAAAAFARAAVEAAADGRLDVAVAAARRRVAIYPLDDAAQAELIGLYRRRGWTGAAADAAPPLRPALPPRARDRAGRPGGRRGSRPGRRRTSRRGSRPQLRSGPRLGGCRAGPPRRRSRRPASCWRHRRTSSRRRGGSDGLGRRKRMARGRAARQRRRAARRGDRARARRRPRVRPPRAGRLLRHADAAACVDRDCRALIDGDGNGAGTCAGRRLHDQLHLVRR